MEDWIKKKNLNGKTCLIYGINTKDCKEKRDFRKW